MVVEKQIWEKFVNARPHPSPLPRGEGEDANIAGISESCSRFCVSLLTAAGEPTPSPSDGGEPEIVLWVAVLDVNTSYCFGRVTAQESLTKSFTADCCQIVFEGLDLCPGINQR